MKRMQRAAISCLPSTNCMYLNYIILFLSLTGLITFSARRAFSSREFPELLWSFLQLYPSPPPTHWDPVCHKSYTPIAMHVPIITKNCIKCWSAPRRMSISMPMFSSFCFSSIYTGRMSFELNKQQPIAFMCRCCCCSLSFCIILQLKSLCLWDVSFSSGCSCLSKLPGCRVRSVSLNCQTIIQISMCVCVRIRILILGDLQELGSRRKNFIVCDWWKECVLFIQIQAKINFSFLIELLRSDYYTNIGFSLKIKLLS